MQYIKINENDAGQRVDRFISKFVPKMPYSMIQKFIRSDRVLLDEKRVEADTILKEGQVLFLYMYDDFVEKFQYPETLTLFSNNPLDIVYKDSNIMILNKPANYLTHQSDEGGDENLLDDFISYLIDHDLFFPEEELTFTPGFANRLDFSTSGLILGALNRQALEDLNELMRNRKIKRYYLAYVEGFVKDQKIKKSLARNEEDFKTDIDPEGKKAETIISHLYEIEGNSVIEAELITGRTHQIRAHLASIGHPLMGDVKYGGKRNYYGRNLMAYKIDFAPNNTSLSYLSNRNIEIQQEKFFLELE